MKKNSILFLHKVISDQNGDVTYPTLYIEKFYVNIKKLGIIFWEL